MKKFIILLIVLVGVIIIGKSSLASPERIFRVNVINPIPPSVTGLKYAKDRKAMHGAMIFSFHADKDDIESIIQYNKLEKLNAYRDVPKSSRYVIEEIFNGIAWWDTDRLKMMRVFGKVTEGEYDWDAMFLFVDENGNVYIVDI